MRKYFYFCTPNWCVTPKTTHYRQINSCDELYFVDNILIISTFFSIHIPINLWYWLAQCVHIVWILHHFFASMYILHTGESERSNCRFYVTFNIFKVSNEWNKTPRIKTIIIYKLFSFLFLNFAYFHCIQLERKQKNNNNTVHTTSTHTNIVWLLMIRQPFSQQIDSS